MIGLSPLSAGHRRRFQPTCVRPSTGSYPRFSLPTDSSPGFASAARDSSRPVKARFRSGSLSVNLAPRQRLAGSFYKRHAVTTESCSDCSWAHGFRYCFTPLPGCFSPFPHGTGTLSVRQVCLDLPHGRGRFTRDSTRPALLGTHDRKTASFQVRGWHPLRPGLQACSPGKPFYDSRPVRRNRDTRSRNTTDATPDGYHAPMVWSDPLSLATTHGVSLPAGTEMFHFPAYPRNNKVPCRPMTAGGLPHSEILGSKPCWRLPEAYRILKRPSSVLSAKASTIRPSGRHTPRKTLMIAFLRQTTNHHTVKNDHKTIDLETKLN